MSRALALILVLGALLTAAITPAFGQGRPAAAATAPLIGAVDVRFEGVRNVSSEAVLANVQVREGTPYDQNLIDRSIRSLYATGLFDYLEVRQETMADSRLRLTFVVTPRYRLERITYEGNQDVRSRRLEREIDSRPQGVLDERLIRADRDKLVTFYQKRGYSGVQIDYRIDRNTATGYGTVVFTVNEGNRRRISRVEFVGNATLSGARLRRQMETKSWNWLSWLTGSGRFDETKFQDDLDRVREMYRNQGFLDIDISDANVRLETPTAKTMKITIQVDEGRQYRLGDISFTGNTLFPSEVLRAYLRMQPGEVFAPEKLDKDRETLTDFYGNFGYLDTEVRPERVPNLQTGAIDLRYQIRESDQFYVQTINLEGNTTTKTVVVLRELALAPGDVFNLVRMKASEQRLKNTGFFEERIQVGPEPTNIPLRRNLKISLQEGRTGNFTFGAGFSSVESAVVFFELTQGNFDIKNYRNFFQGGGQKFRLRASVGSRYNEFILSFVEPWLFEQRLEFGVELFRTETNYNSALYNELRSGVEFSFRRRLIELWEGRIAYRYEVVDIRNVDPGAPQVILDEAGSRSVSKVSLTLLRDTRNSMLYPTMGNRFLMITEFAGVGGDTEYLRLEAHAAQFFPTFEFLDQSIALLGRVGTIWDYGSDPIPFFDRVFLGGPRSLRGFDYRQVGPKDLRTGEPLGGNSYAFASLEYTFKIAEPLRFALFYDWGFVNPDPFEFDPVDFNDNWGFGIRLHVMGAPLSLDYGIPLRTDRFNDKGGQFFFSFGTRF